MKLKNLLENVGGFLLVILVLLIFSPLMLLVLLGALLCTPFDYIQFKRSRYRRDFPSKYRWLSGEHADGRVYATVKDANFPIDYLRPESFDSEFPGYFLCGDTLLNFSHPLFFEKKSGRWLLWAGKSDDNGGEENSDTDVDEQADFDEDEEVNYDDCLEISDAGAFCAEQFREYFPQRACNRAVFFYEREATKQKYGAAALEILEHTDGFVVYSKKHLRGAIADFTNQRKQETGVETK